MGSMFRSEEMGLCQLFIQPEAAYLSVSELGETGTVQFRDLNADVNYFQRKFVNEVRRCDEMERKLRYIEAEVKKDDVPISEVLNDLPRAPNPREVIDLEAHIEKTENDILELSHNAVNLKSNYLELTELRHVLEKTQVFFTEQEEANESLTRALINDEQQYGAAGRGRLEFVAGVICRERVPAFERMLWRISRGNVFLRQVELEAPLEDPNTGNQIYKTVFVAFFQGEQLKSRLKKVCTGFHASLYPCPNSNSERLEMVKGVCTRLEDLNLVLNQTQDHRQRVLHSVAKELPNWNIMVKKMKAIYHTMNLFNMDVSKKCLIGECWVPMADMGVVRNCLEEGSRLCGGSIPSFMNLIHTDENPPTFNRTNKFTKGFQTLIDAYGVASYREANPALYTIITFPFLFGVMFGDIGHGLLLTLFAGWMVTCEKSLSAKKSTNEIWNIFFAGRYIILLMGFFSMYTGFIYNDIFSKSMNIFGSQWKNPHDWKKLMKEEEYEIYPHESHNDTYYAGLDPVWSLAKNKIIFLNSYKMKLSIIFGVVHMIFGVCVSIPNIIYKKKYSSLLLEFLPQLLLLIFLFGYLTILVIIKWYLYHEKNSIPYNEGCAPSVLLTFINMMLFKSPENKTCNGYMFDGQELLQKTFIFGALLCIPLMLLGKPLWMRHNKNKNIHKNHQQQNNDVQQTQDIELQDSISIPSNGGNIDINNDNDKHTSEHDDGDFSDLMVHQAIHTIEYTLSTVSHTASYLRLWALSLAHAQLSDVLWTMLFRKGMEADVSVIDDPRIGILKGFLLFILFFLWSIFTVAILVMMEGLSAFLHTLRLHWVEFMSKFYEGHGYLFQPFCFKNIIETEEIEE